jgi:hypothetical protein
VLETVLMERIEELSDRRDAELVVEHQRALGAPDLHAQEETQAGRDRGAPFIELVERAVVEQLRRIFAARRSRRPRSPRGPPR